MGMTEVTAADGVRVLDWTFGDRLRKVRRGGGETQAEFAAKLGESVKTYSNWEADRHPPASIVAVAKRVEVATGVPAAWMLGLDQHGPTPPASPARPAGIEPTTSACSARYRASTRWFPLVTGPAVPSHAPCAVPA